jgi:type IV pilus assembly protein PilE
MQMPKHMRGVTLVELLIVVVIIAILTAVAFPNYRNFVIRAKRTEAKAALLKAATNQEKFYLQNQAFTGDLTKLGFSGPPFKSESGTYNLSVAPNPDWAVDFLVTATYTGTDSENAKCPTFKIDGRGNRTSPDGTYADCWTRKN